MFLLVLQCCIFALWSVDSGLYAVHYARAFDGEILCFQLKQPCESNLSEARAKNPYWLFTMFTMAGNVGYLPEDLFEVLGIYARLPIHTKFSLMLLSLVMCRLVCVGRLISLDLELGILLLLIFIICI
ncbi:hypothetical protein GQ55_5G451700 [Panicum hallii var. hallii]|uniref:Uncharacterized protein n=2 Tax=Panicum hallii TaxID=206008 RepID=A0A2T7DQ52_9POAL|nr:hypothetical protein GQ55_5G451700 [Panicum hallii var. hallii]